MLGVSSSHITASLELVLGSVIVRRKKSWVYACRYPATALGRNSTWGLVRNCQNDASAAKFILIYDPANNDARSYDTDLASLQSTVDWQIPSQQLGMSKTQEGAVSKSGIKQLRNGESVIPSSTRADGSVRKEIRVKPGYRPPEDVEVYKNRTAEAWKNRGKGGVPGAEKVEAETQTQQLSASAAKNAKRREARKKAVENEDTKPVAETMPVAETEVDPEVEKAKEARKLAKKLRQARELQDKKNEGGSLLPEQLAKVIKINELIRQLDSLGFNAEGQHKSDEAGKTEE